VSHVSCCREAGGQAARGSAAGSRAADWLAFAASPTFAVAALLAGISGDDAARMLCSGAHASPLGGMVSMYLLMSVFHAAPWLKLMRGRAQRLTSPFMRARRFFMRWSDG